jgi:hypothetical protein
MHIERPWRVARARGERGTASGECDAAIGGGWQWQHDIGTYTERKPMIQLFAGLGANPLRQFINYGG